jgi:pyridoxal phosphate phosphatase PHOSPHO2
MGDASNDFCPSTHLSRERGDLVLARRGLSLEQRIRERPDLVKAEIVYWQDAQDVLEATKDIFFGGRDRVSSLTSTAFSSTTSLSTMVESSSSSILASSPIDEIKAVSATSQQVLSAVESSDSKMFAQAVKA